MSVRPEDLPAAPTVMTRPMASGFLGFLLGTSTSRGPTREEGYASSSSAMLS